MLFAGGPPTITAHGALLIVAMAGAGTGVAISTPPVQAVNVGTVQGSVTAGQSSTTFSFAFTAGQAVTVLSVSPTEAAAMSAVYAFVIAVFVYRDLRIADVPRVLLASANMSAMLLYIITNAALFSFILTNENIPHSLADWILAKDLGLIGFLLLANVLLLIAGNFMEPSSIILIMAPILYPAAVALGVNPVHLGILIDVNMEVGLCHPPVGLNLYVASGISKLGITELTVAVWPWLVTMLIFLVMEIAERYSIPWHVSRRDYVSVAPPANSRAL